MSHAIIEQPPSWFQVALESSIHVLPSLANVQQTDQSNNPYVILQSKDAKVGTAPLPYNSKLRSSKFNP